MVRGVCVQFDITDYHSEVFLFVLGPDILSPGYFCYQTKEDLKFLCAALSKTLMLSMKY